MKRFKGSCQVSDKCVSVFQPYLNTFRTIKKVEFPSLNNATERLLTPLSSCSTIHHYISTFLFLYMGPSYHKRPITTTPLSWALLFFFFFFFCFNDSKFVASHWPLLITFLFHLMPFHLGHIFVFLKSIFFSRQENKNRAKYFIFIYSI